MAAVQSMGRRKRTPALRIAKNSNFAAASSLGKFPRVLMILRNDRCKLSRALVAGMKILVPMFGCGFRDRGVWCDHPRQRHREHY